MAGRMRRSWFGLVLLACAVFVFPVSAFCCPFCNMQGPTLTSEANLAALVLYGELTNANQTPKPGAPDGTTDLVIESVVKKHPIVANLKVITLPRYMMQLPTKDKYKFLVFCDIFQNRLDPYRGVAVKDGSDMAKYLKGALEVKDEKTDKRLRFFFDYLDNTETEISNDAYKEFGNADYKDYKDLACKLPADRLVKWLTDPKTPAFRYGLYASMLGHCGTTADANVLRKMLEDPENRVASGVDGILAGYILLKHQEGWQYLQSILQDGTKEFPFRYAALRTARFFWDNRSDIVSKKDLAAALSYLLTQKDIADLVIEDFRKWKHWEMTDRILSLQKHEIFSVGVVRRAVLRFALSAGLSNEAARCYVDEQRKKDPQMVRDSEELLKLDAIVNAP